MVFTFLLAGLVTLGVFLVFASFALNANTPSRVQTLATQYAKPSSLEELQFSQPFSQRVILPALHDLARVMVRFTPQQLIDSSHRKLELAGNPYDLPAVEFVGLRGISAVLMTLVFALLFTLMHAELPVLILLMASGAGLGFYLPLFWLNLKIRERRDDIQYALPDALDLLTICVEAGMGLDQAMGKVAEKWDNHLARGFGRAMTEIRLGRTRAAVLRDMANRADVTELTNFVAALIQADEHGTPVARILRIQSDQMRVLRRQRAQERANKIPIQLLFPLVFFVFPTIFIVLLGPALLRLMATFPH